MNSPKRRSFIKKSMLSGFALVIGTELVFAKYLPKNLIPIAIKNKIKFYKLPEKSTLLRVLNDRPVNAETPAHLLNDKWTPNELFFVRNNGLPPQDPDANEWTLSIYGESAKSKITYTLKQLKEIFKIQNKYITLECGGNGRKEFYPPAKGNQWSTGAVGCAKWTGVKLKDVLEDVGIKSDAVYIGYYGADTHLSGDTNKDAISRGVPISKALEDESLIAWAMNDNPLPLLNGYPLRLVFGGFPASCSGKWLEKIVIRNKIHDGQKMGGKAYRTPCNPVAPGSKINDKDMCIIEKMPVKSLITFPKTGATINIEQKLPVAGHAWTSALAIKQVDYSIDFGKTWHKCNLEDSINRFAWQNFNASIKFPKKGYYEVWARAKDSEGDIQSVILAGWNPKGYLNNACHRIAIKVE